MKTLILITLLFLTLSIPGCAQFHNVKGIRVVDRATLDPADTATISGVGQIQYDGTDDKFRFNDGVSWYSFLRDDATLPYWPLTGSASLTGTTSIDINGNDLTIGDPTFTEGFIGFSSGVSVLGYGSQYFAADATGIGINLPSGADGDIYYGTEDAGFNYLNRLAAASSGNVLLSGTSPSWGKVGLTTHVSGTLGVANGGTGKTSIAANRLLWSTSSDTYGERSIGNLLTMTGSALEFGGTATATTNLLGASQAFNFGTSGSAFGTTEFNLGSTTFNLGSTTFNCDQNSAVFDDLRSIAILSDASDSDGYSAMRVESSGSVTGTNQASILKLFLPAKAVWTTSDKAALRITTTANLAGSFTDERLISLFDNWNPNAGTGNWYGVHIQPIFNTTGTYSGAARGFYYNPTLTSVTGLTNIAWENTSGLVRFGEGIQIDEGTNETMGTATLSSGTITVNTTKVTANSRIFLTVNGGTLTNVGTPYISARVAGTSFTITSTNGSDASDVAWLIIEPAP